MKHNTILLLLAGFLLIFFSNPSEARFDLWETENGEMIRQGTHVFWTGTSMITDGNGHWCIAWADARNGTMDVYIQLYDENGNELWTPGGVLIGAGPYPEELPLLVYSGGGEWIIAWQDYRLDTDIVGRMVVYAQKLNSSGEKLWGDEGVFIGPEGGNTIESKYQNPPSIVATSDGGIICVFENGINDYDSQLFAQRLDTNGNFLWGDQSILIAEDPSDYRVCSDGNNGIFYVCYDHALQDGNYVTIHRIDGDGNQCFGNGLEGIGLDNDIDCGHMPEITSDGNNGAFVCWRLHEGIYNYRIIGQQVSADGDLLWNENGVQLSPNIDDWIEYQIFNSADNEYILAWKGYRTSCSAQKIGSVNGEPVLYWGSLDEEYPHMEIYNPVEEGRLESLNSDGDGGFVVSFTTNIDHEEYGQQRNFSLMRFDSDCQPVWNQMNTVTVGNHGCSSQDAVALNNRIIFAWRETRLPDNGIFFQSYDINSGQSQIAEKGLPVVSGITNLTRYPQIIRSGESAYISWADGRYSSEGQLPYMQRVDVETGQAMWNNNGIIIVPGYLAEHDSVSSYLYYSIDMVPAANNGVISIWASDNMYAQRVDENGFLHWGDNGIQLFNADDYYFGSRIRKNVFQTEDGALVIAEIGRYGGLGNQIRMQRINNQGELLLADNGLLLHEVNDQENFFLQGAEQLNDGSILVVWSEQYDLKAVRVSCDGEFLWNEPIFLRTVDSLRPAVEVGVTDNVIVVAYTDWVDEVNLTYLTYINENGIVTNDDNEVSLLDNENPTSLTGFCTDQNNIWVTLEENFTIYLARLDNNQTQLDEDDIQQVWENDSRVHDTQIVSDGYGGVYVFWETGSREGNIYYKHYDSSLQTTHRDYDDAPMPLVDIRYSQSQMSMVPDNQGGVLTVWNDWRATIGQQEGDDVYAMRVFDSYKMNGINNKNDTTIPVSWALHEAYPNPFNPSTTISFSAANTSNVKLYVYDIMGREVARLVDNVIAAGDHSIVWNASDNNGKSIASGTYIYRLESKGFAETRTMILLK